MGGWFIVGLATARPISPNHPNQSRGADGGNKAHSLGMSGWRLGTVRDTPKPTGPKPHIAEFRTPRDGRRRVVRAIGNELRVMYTEILKEPLPRRITDLLRRLERKR